MGRIAEERKEIHDAFVACKKHLLGPDLTCAEGDCCRLGSEYICFALNSAPVASWLAKKVINNRLFPYTSYDMWLLGQGIKITLPDGDTDRSTLQLSRHAWLDSLIEEFSH